MITTLEIWLLFVPITAVLMIGGPIVIGIAVYRRHMKNINQGKLPENSDQDYVEAIEDLNEEFRLGQVSTEKQISVKDEIKRLLND